MTDSIEQQALNLFQAFKLKGADEKSARRATAEAMGVEVDSARRYLQTARSRGLAACLIEEAPETGPAPSEEDLKEAWEELKQRAKKNISAAASQGRATIRLLDDRPIGIAFFTDEHIGNELTDYERMEYDTEIVRTTDGMYAIDGGDVVDNFISPKILEPLFHGKVPPGQQYALAGYHLAKFGGKILALVSGNHEHRTRMAAGIDKLADIIADKRILYDKHEFQITLKLGTQEYKIKIRHKPGRWGSSYNHTHAPKQLLRFNDSEDIADVIVVGHHHVPDFETLPMFGKKRAIIRTGTYKAADDYERGHAFSDGGYMVPTVIFRPDRRSITIIDDLEEARDYITFLRQQYDRR